MLSAHRQIVVELPMSTDPLANEFRTELMYYSIFHRQPEINGRGDLEPDWYASFVLSSQRFPSAETLNQFKAFGVQLIILHTDKLEPEKYLDTNTADDRCGEVAAPRGSAIRSCHCVQIGIEC
jgi:hypothetical protein